MVIVKVKSVVGVVLKMVGYLYQQEMEVGEKLTEIIDQVIEKNEKISTENKLNDEVKSILDEIIQKVCEKSTKKKKKLTKKQSKDEVINEENIKSEPECPNIKGILKPRRCHCCTNNHVDFVHAPVMIRAYDETKDFTIDIQFVEEHPKRIVSYKQLFAEQRKAENSNLEIQDR